MLNASGVKDLNYVTGINSTYKGIELDLMYRLHKNIDIIFPVLYQTTNLQIKSPDHI